VSGARRVLGLVERSGVVLALLAFAGAALWLFVRTGLPILSYDDIYRTLFAREWAVRPYLFTERLVWLPFPLALAGVAIRLTREAFWTALAVDLAATGVAVWFVHELARRLFGRLAAWIAASLVGLTPWVLFLALSRYGEPVLLATTAAGVHFWLRWSERGRARELAAASLALGAAVLTRYEAWPLGVALPAHVALAGIAPAWFAPRGWRRPGWPALWSALPLAGMAIWVAKNLVVYHEPLYGGAFGFLPTGAPAGALAGLGLGARHLWQLNPILVVLGVVGLGLHGRRAPLLVWLLGLSVVVPWYTVSTLPVEVAFPIRLMVVPLALLAPFAGAALARITQRRAVSLVLAAVVMAIQSVVALRAEYPSAPLPMTQLALTLERNGTLDRFDAIYVQSPRRTGYPDEVRVATNFRRPVHVLPVEAAPVAWARGAAEAVLILNDGREPPAGAGRAFEIGRVPPMVAWGICTRAVDQDDRAEWPEASAPRVARAGAVVAVDLRVRNAGPRAWRRAACGPLVAHRWRGPGEGPSGDEVRTPIASRVEPGQVVAVPIAVEAPRSAGRYVLEIDLLAHPSAAFGARGATLRLPIDVTSAPE
jgi:hypothetical protein